jgi:hypothetical protein
MTSGTPPDPLDQPDASHDEAAFYAFVARSSAALLHSVLRDAIVGLETRMGFAVADGRPLLEVGLNPPPGATGAACQHLGGCTILEVSNDVIGTSIVTEYADGQVRRRQTFRRLMKARCTACQGEYLAEMLTDD